MPLFRYHAIDQLGKENRGMVYALSIEELRLRFSQEKNFLLSARLIKKKSITWQRDKHQLYFLKQFSLCLAAGLTVMEALRSVQTVTHPNIRWVLPHVMDTLQQGQPLSYAFSLYSDIFPSVFIKAVQQAEINGSLSDTLLALVEYLEKQSNIKQWLYQAMIYPAFVLTVTLVITLFLLEKILPTMLTIFEDAQQTLPAITVIFLSVSAGIRRFWWMAILGIGSLILGGRWIGHRFPTWRYRWQALLLHTPVIGFFIKERAWATFAQALWLFRHAGIDLINALRYATQVVDNQVLQSELSTVVASIHSGNSLEHALSSVKYFPKLSWQLIASGERSGKLDDMLQHVARFHLKQYQDTIAWMIRLIEPVLMLCVGALVLGIVLSLLLPVFTMNVWGGS